MTNRSAIRIALKSLMCGASLIGIATTAHASRVLFSTDPNLAGIEVAPAREISVEHGTTQISLDSGAIASFVDAARFVVRADGSVDLHTGTMTIVRASEGQTKVYMPDGVEGAVEGNGSSASFTTLAKGGRGSVISGGLSLTAGGVTKQFRAGSFWSASADRAPGLIVANTPAIVPGAGTVQPMREGGIVAVASNGIPVTLGDGLAAAGVTGDILAAGKRLDAFDRNPSLAAFPTGDYALLTSYAAQAASPYGSPAFRGAGADIVLAYFQYLAVGKSGSDFRSAYAQFLLGYLDLVRSGALPSSFKGATQSQLSAYIAYAGRTDGFGNLSAANQTLLDAYLAFLSTGGTADNFAPNARTLVGTYFDYVRGGGDPAKFATASQAIVNQYIAILQSGGIKTQLSAANQALLDAYFASLVKSGNGLAFATTEGTALVAFKTYLDAGGLPSAYTAVDAATLQAYLEKLSSTGLFDRFLGSQAVFLRSYLSYLQAGGTIDGFESLPINVLTRQANALNSYYDYIQSGGTPSLYTTLSQAQIVAYLAAIQNAGLSAKLLAGNASFLADYYAYLQTGANPDVYTGLPNLNFPLYASQLASFSAYLRAGNLPSGYSALTAQQIQAYLNALNASGHFTLLGNDSAFLTAYFAYLSGGGSPDAFTGLPIATYRSYATALNAYYTFLNNGGLPSAYTALSQADIQAYLTALQSNGQLASLLGNNSNFLAAYLGYLQTGGNADNYSSLPILAYQNYAAALNAYYAFLAKGGTPSAYTGLSQGDILAYLTALKNAGQLDALLAGNATFLASYLAYIQGGGNADKYASLPIVAYQSYATALNAYYLFLAGGGKPSAYTALSQADILAYLNALKSAGQFATLLGSNAGYLDAYLAYVSGGGIPDQYAALPVNQVRTATYAGGITTKTNGAFDRRTGAIPVELDANGYPVAFGTLRVGTAVLTDNLKTPEYVIGRYTNGTASEIKSGVTTTTTFGPNDSLQFALATTLPTALPTSGIVTMGIAASTTPSFGDSSAVSNASLTGGVAVAFGAAPKIGIAGILKLTNAGTAQTYNFTSDGGLAAPSQGLSTSSSVAGSTPAGFALAAVSSTDVRCGTGCALGATLALGGTTGNVAAGTYVISGSKLAINGALVATAATPVGAIPVATIPTPGIGIGTNVTLIQAPTVVSGFLAGGPSDPHLDGVVTNATGQPIDFTTDGKILTAVSTQFLSGPGWVLGRYSNGSVISSTGRTTIIYGLNDSFQYVVQAPSVNLPTNGTVQYTITAATQPTFAGGARTFDNATTLINLGVQFGSAPKFGYEGLISGNINGTTPASVRFSTAGGATAPSLAAFPANAGALSLLGKAPVTDVTTNLCDSPAVCTLSANFISGGYAAATFGVGWGLVTTATGISVLNGAGVLTKGTTVIPAPAPSPPTSTALSDANVFVRIAPGKGYGFSYGNPSSSGGTVVFIDGKPNQLYDPSYSFTPFLLQNTADNVDVGGDQYTTIGRWSNGVIYAGQQTQTLSANQGQPYVVYTPAVSIPKSGTVDYSIFAKTAVTRQSPTLLPGTFDAKLRVAFGTDGSQSARVAVLGSIVVPDAGSTVTGYSIGDQATYDATAKYGALVYVNGAISFSEAIAKTAGTGVANYDLCPDQATCRITFSGGASGPQAARFGLVYGTSASIGRNAVGGQSYGAVIFGADGTFLPGTVPPPKVAPGDAPTGLNMSVVSTSPYRNGVANTGAYLAASPAAQLAGYSYNGGLVFDRGTATDNESGSASGIVGWTRWAGGATNGSDPQTYAANGGISLAWGQAATAIPTTGKVSYTLVGSTAPTAQDGSLTPGSVSSAALAVDFGTKKVGVEVGISIGGASYAINSVGGVATPSLAYSGTTFAGTNTNGKGVAGFNGFLAGAGASHAGVAYTFQPAGVPSLMSPLTGVVVFAKGN